MRGMLVLLLCSGAALAEGPPPEYFTGTYERVGRNADSPPGLINDVVRLSPAPGGVALSECGAGPQEPLSLVLSFDRSGETPNLLVGTEGPFGLWCVHGNAGDNYPFLSCTSDMGARFLLWPEPDAPCAP